MVRKTVRESKRTVTHEAIPSNRRQAGTKESPILLLSDDESGAEGNVRRPSTANAASRKAYLGVSPSDTYTFKGHGSAYDVMIAMGYKPDRGLGQNLRGNLRPLPIELRKSRAGVGYRATSPSRSPSPAPPSKKAPVKIVRPPKESVASTSKTSQPVAKAATQTSSRLKPKAHKPIPSKSVSLILPQNLSTQPTPGQSLLSPPAVISPPPPMTFAPPDFYISMMSGLAMAGMPQTMQAAAVADPMAAFQLAQMYFASPSPFPLSPFPLVSPQPDHVATQLHFHPPSLPPRPVSNPTTKSNLKLTPVPPSSPSSVFQEDNSDSVPTLPSASVLDPPSVTVEMDPFVLKQKRQARRNNIGWIPEPGFPDRGAFNLIPTVSYARWPLSDGVTPPNPQRSLVMEDLPCNCRTIEFVRSWADQFPATAVCLNGGAKALIEFPSREAAEAAYDSPRLRGGPFDRAKHVRVFWYRPHTDAAIPVPIDTTGGNDAEGSTGEGLGTPNDAVSAIISSAIKGLLSPVIDDSNPKEETTEARKATHLTGKGSSLPPPELHFPGVGLPVRSSTAPAFVTMPGSPVATLPMNCEQKEQNKQSIPTLRFARRSQGGPDHMSLGRPTPPSPSAPLTPPTEVVSPDLRSLSLESIERQRTPSGSPPSLRYPSSTPEMAGDRGRIPSPSEGSTGHGTISPPSTPSPPMAGNSSLEQQLRMRLLAMKQTRIMSRNHTASTPSTIVDDSEVLLKTVSPPIPQTPASIGISESLELLATSFIADTIQAAQGLPSEPERFDAVIGARLNRKRGSNDAFGPGSSADIAFKRQRLAQQIEESKRIMEQWKAAKTKEERNRIYALWEESNRSVEILSKPSTVPFRWPCYAEGWLVVDSDDEGMEIP